MWKIWTGLLHNQTTQKEKDIYRFDRYPSLFLCILGQLPHGISNRIIDPFLGAY